MNPTRLFPIIVPLSSVTASDRAPRLARRRCWSSMTVYAIVTAAGLAAAGCTASSSQPTPARPAAAEATASGGLGMANAPLSSAFASPATSIRQHSAFTGPPSDPFSGTPADHWANGASGIVVPPATPIGEFPAGRVRFAYQRTRQLLIAATLTRTTLLGGSPAAFTRLLTGQQRAQFLAALTKTGLDKQGNPVSSRSDITSFAPGSTQLIGTVIKVHGTMRAHEATTKAGFLDLDVNVDYIFVYPIEPPHQPTRWMRIVTQMAWTVIFSAWTGAATPFEPWVVFNESFAGTTCGTTDGYLHPDYPGSQAGAPAPSVSPSGTPVDPYAMATTGPPGCQRTTGT